MSRDKLTFWKKHWDGSIDLWQMYKTDQILIPFNSWCERSLQLPLSISVWKWDAVLRGSCAAVFVAVGCLPSCLRPDFFRSARGSALVPPVLSDMLWNASVMCGVLSHGVKRRWRAQTVNLTFIWLQMEIVSCLNESVGGGAVVSGGSLTHGGAIFSFFFCLCTHFMLHLCCLHTPTLVSSSLLLGRHVSDCQRLELLWEKLFILHSVLRRSFGTESFNLLICWLD